MERLRKYRTKANQIAESTLIGVAILVMGIVSLTLMDVIALHADAELWLGRLLAGVTVVSLFTAIYRKNVN